MSRVRKITFGISGLIALPNFENVRVHYEEEVELSDNDDVAQVRKNVIARVEKTVDAEIAEIKAGVQRNIKSKKG